MFSVYVAVWIVGNPFATIIFFQNGHNEQNKYNNEKSSNKTFFLSGKLNQQDSILFVSWQWSQCHFDDQNDVLYWSSDGENFH